MTDTVTLISSDNREFTVSEEVANESETLRMFFDRNKPFVEAAERRARLPIRAALLRRAIEYMEYKHKNEKRRGMQEFIISDEETLDLLDVSAYLRL